MAQSLSSVFLHIVFSTKDRFPFLGDVAVQSKVHSYLAGIARERGCPPVLVGGVADHVHLLVQMGRTVSQAELVKELKRSSTVWVRQQFPELAKFSWQAGYGVFSVSVSNLESVRAYIARQEGHHARVGFQEEFRSFLKKHRLEFDERFVWD
ncbi:MAG: IS200/IS605 family transposase [Terrimicrobiaceae bacterium]|nr:IS200/IS605 family transposase [Terrimicrobiaceae bacterium]